jgi:hypothetical protein
MKRSIAIVGLFALLAGCAWHGGREVNRGLVLETATEAGYGPTAASFPVPPQEEKKPQEGPAKQEPGKTTVAPVEETEIPWERMNEEAELAIIKDELKRPSAWRVPRRARPYGVTAFGQVEFAANRDALVTPGFQEPTWNELLKQGWGAGLEVSYQPLPALQPYLGAKYESYSGGTKTYRYVGVTIAQETSRVQLLPVYAGLQLNFPLHLATDRWFDPAAAGRATGVIPFLQIGGGVAYSFGNEIEIRDLTNSITRRLDFIRPGYTAYLEGAVGVEYRTPEGFALRLSVGIESYPNLKLEREYEQAVPGADIERLGQAILPRISASFYF